MGASSLQSQVCHPCRGLRSDNVAVNESCVSARRHSLANVQLKDHFSCGDEFTPKVRKPYTIRKQRERWKEEEHEKFLEALKLYGRDWRQIEEHVGTKTAVQIRSHAQKFFSKVTRNSNGSSAALVGCIEIPPPRPKRKPLHPYPRKEAHNLPKAASISEQTRSLSPQLSVSEKESQSPTSIVLATSSSDTLISAHSSVLHDSASPDWLIPFENEPPTPALETTNSIPHEKISKNLELLPKDDVNEKDVSTQEVSMQSLKLFGRTVLVTDPHKSTTTVETCASEPDHKLRGNYKQSSLWNSIVMESTGNTECTWSHGAFYFIQLNNGNSNQGAGSAVPGPWWSSYGGCPFSFVHYFKRDTDQANSDLNAEVDDKNIHEDQSWCGSNTRSVNGDKCADIDIQSYRLFSEVANIDPDSVSKHELIKKPLFSKLRTGHEKNTKGFVPYKRCMAERVTPSTITGSEGEEKRIRLCL